MLAAQYLPPAASYIVAALVALICLWAWRKR